MFVKRLFIVGILFLSACFITGSYFDHKYRKAWSTLFFSATDTILAKDKNYDIILLGDSRIHFGLNPYYIDSVTGLSSYNFAIGGSDAAMLKLNSTLYLQQHPAPKFVVIGAGNSMIKAPLSVKSQFHFLYYLKEDAVYDQLKKYYPGLLLVKYLPFLKYAYFDEYNRRSVFARPIKYERFEHNIYKGFINTHQFENTRGKIDFGIDTSNRPIDSLGINMIKEVITGFTKAGSQVILVSPPFKEDVQANTKPLSRVTDSVFLKLAEECKVPFIKSDDPIYTDDKFIDERHLNEPGSRIFSRKIGEYIRHYSLK